MSDEQATDQTFEQVVEAFYPTEKSEPLKAPPEEAVKDDDPEEGTDPKSEDDEGEEESTEDDATDDEGEGDESEEEDSDNLVYEINGKDYTAKDIERLETKAKHTEADYTRKVTALAEKSKGFDSELAKTKDLTDQLEVLIGEDSEINWTELKADDPDEYIRLKERSDNRKAKLEEVKASNKKSEGSNVDYNAVNDALADVFPEWINKDGKTTDAFSDDLKSLNAYYVDNGWTKEQTQRVSEDATLVKLVLDDVKRKANSKATEQKKAKAKKKIIATPKIGKSAAVHKQTLKPHEIMYGKDKD